MDNISISGLASSQFGAVNSSRQQQPSAVDELLAPNESQAVAQPTQELPATSQVANTENAQPTENNDTRAEDQTRQQQQIESFLAERTGQNPQNFEGIDIQSALELQESFRERPEAAATETTAANDSSGQPADANEQQNQEIQQRLQSRLAEQIPTDPGTEFPQLIETVA